jgi:hypothetical protein
MKHQAALPETNALAYFAPFPYLTKKKKFNNLDTRLILRRDELELCFLESQNFFC